jgi:hypothetical protein
MKGEESMVVQVIYTWPDGREEVRYERTSGTEGARNLRIEVEALQAAARHSGFVSPYSLREVEEAGSHDTKEGGI